MPANYAHHRFGREVLPALPGDVRQCIQRFRRMYDAGLHGPDIFFYFNPFWKTAVGGLGSAFHRQTGQEFFANACKGASSEAARAYLYGLLGHYCLDSACHPLVNRLSSIGEARHVVLESEFDRYLMVLDREPHPECFDMSRWLKLTRGECMSVAEFYPGTTGGNISRCVKSMAFHIRFLAAENWKPREKLLKKWKPSLCDYRIPAEEQEELTLYVRELHELYRQAVERYPEMLRQLTEFMASGEGLGEDFTKDFG